MYKYENPSHRCPLLLALGRKTNNRVSVKCKLRQVEIVAVVYRRNKVKYPPCSSVVC